MLTQIKYLLLILLVAPANYLSAQALNLQYNFKQLNVQNGLAQNIVYHFLQDSKGYIWLGTHNGLTMYDGARAVSFMHDEQKANSLASNFITCILEDSAQQVWIGNEKGIDLFNRNNNTFSHYGVDRSGGEKDNTFCVPVAIVSSKEFWFIDTKTKSLRAFNIKTKTSRFVCSMGEVDGTIYINSSTRFIHFWSYQSIGTIHLVFKGNTLVKKQNFFSSDDSFHHPLQIVHALQQNDSTTWLSTNEGLVCLNAFNSTYKIYDHWKGDKIKELRCEALSPDSILWIGSGPSGVYTFDTKKREFINNYKNNRLDPFSICSNNIVSVYFDKSGDVWCGSYGSGASYASIESNFFAKHSIDEKESTNNIIWTGLDNNENCWCIVEDENGFWVFDKTLTKSKNLLPLPDDEKTFVGSMYKLVFTKSGNAWIVTNKGLYMYNVNTNRMHRVKYPLLSDANFGSNWMRDMFRLHDGSVIFSTFAGLYRITEVHGNAVVALYSKLNEIYDKSFTRLYQDESENIYIKGDDSLFILQPGENYEQPALIKSIAFPVDLYQCFSDAAQNVVYIATSDGLYILDKKNYTLKKQNFIEHMPFQSVSCVFEKDGKLWLFGEKGLYYFNEKDKQCRMFTIEDGLPGNEFNVSAIGFSTDEKCIAGNTNGLVSFYPDKFLKNLYPPRAQLDHIYINDTLYKPANNANETNNIRLTYKENTFAFDFSAITFQHNSDCVYEYKLQDYDKDWIKSSATHFTRYSKISPGDYTFKLRVYDMNGVISPFTKELQIEISKAFWQTTLFRIALLIIVLSICRMFIKWYLSAKIRKQKIIFEKQQAVDQERTRIAMEMHDDLGSGLTAIRYLAGSLPGQATEVLVKAHIGKNYFELKISDNGKGIEPEKTMQFGNGLKSMKRRAQEMNAQLDILSSSGTTIIVSLPFR